MSYGSSSIVSGGLTNKRAFEFGRTHVVKPKGRHQATIIWLHGLGDNGASLDACMEFHALWFVLLSPEVWKHMDVKKWALWSQLLEALPLPNIKWICPTAPTRPVAAFGGFACTAWFDVGEFSENAFDDIEGIDASATHVANLLSAEPVGIKLGIGGFSMGASTALYSALCFAHGRFGSGNMYPVNISIVVALSGSLPCYRSLKNKVESSQDSSRRASSLSLLLCHGKADDVVLYKHGEKAAESLRSSFRNVTFKAYNGVGHYTVPEEMDDVCKWLTARLGLDGSH